MTSFVGRERELGADRRAARALAARHAARPGRRGQDAARARGRGPAPGRGRRRRVAGRARADHRRVGDRPRGGSARSGCARRCCRGMAPRDTLDRLLDVLAERDAIIVLDNCEHVIAGAADLADALLEACPRLKIVATSREALAIDGEALVPVPPLARVARADAVRRPRGGRPPRLRGRRRRARDLPPAGRAAAGARAGRRAPAHAHRGRAGRAPRRPLPRCSPAAAAPRSRATARCARWSTGAGSCSTSPSGVLARRLSIFTAGATVASASAVYGDDAFDGLAALAERSLAAGRPGRRADPLPDARDDPRVRAREARGGGRAGDGARARTRASSPTSWRRPSRSCAGPSSGAGSGCWTPSASTCSPRCATSARCATRARRCGWPSTCCGCGCSRAASRRPRRGRSSRSRCPARPTRWTARSPKGVLRAGQPGGSSGERRGAHRPSSTRGRCAIDDARRPLVALAQGRAGDVRRRGGREQEVGGARASGPVGAGRGRIFCAGRAENDGDIAAMGEHLASGREQLDGGRRLVRARHGAVPRVRPADAGRRSRGRRSACSRRCARRSRRSARTRSAG